MSGRKKERGVGRRKYEVKKGKRRGMEGYRRVIK